MSGRAARRGREIAADLAAARATWIVAAVLLLIQVAIHRLGTPVGVFEVLGLSREGLAAGRVWQLLSYALVHGSWGHLAVNGFLLVGLGPRLERIGGSRTLLQVLGAGILMGGLAHLAVSRGPAGSVDLVGISGGLVAMLLWLTGVSPDSRMWPLLISGKNLGRGILLASGILALLDPRLGLPLLGSWGARLADLGGVFSASHACHFGGGIAGWLLARRVLRPRVTRAQLERQRARREAREARRS